MVEAGSSAEGSVKTVRPSGRVGRRGVTKLYVQDVTAVGWVDYNAEGHDRGLETGPSGRGPLVQAVPIAHDGAEADQGDGEGIRRVAGQERGSHQKGMKAPMGQGVLRSFQAL